MDTRYLFTSEQVDLIQEMIDRVRHTPLPSQDDTQEDGGSSPDVYIVKTPDEGIPKMSSAGTGTGTGASPAEGDTLGSASCLVYRVNPDTGVIYETELSKTVYNLSAFAIYGNIFITIKRDKFGIWVADPIPLLVILFCSK